MLTNTDIRVMGSYLMFIDAISIGIFSASALCWNGKLELVNTQIANITQITSIIFCSTIIIAFILTGHRMHAYHTRRTDRLSDELSALTEVSFYSIAVAAFATELLTNGLSRNDYLMILGLSICGMLTLRVIMRAVIRRMRIYGRDYRVWLIVGNNARTKRLVDSILANPHFGIRLKEIVDLPYRAGDEFSDEDTSFSADYPSGLELHPIEDTAEIRDIIEKHVIDEVVITLPIRSHYDQVQKIMDICTEAGVTVKLPPNAFGHNARISITGETPMVAHLTGPSSIAQLAIKRIIDIIGAIIGLVLFSPLFLVIAIAIRLDSPGPILFRATRIGLRGRKFTMIKFRSMVENAPDLQESLRSLNETDGIAFKIKNDPRITPVGNFLRQYHLDELPQLWNVLVGDMSLVGPRPLPPAEATGNEWWQRRRLSMPPGLTCYWQIKGDHIMPFNQWVQLDLSYIDEWSVWLDLKLIFLTLFALVRRQGW